MEKEAHESGVEAKLYPYPLILMEDTCHVGKVESWFKEAKKGR